MTIYLEQFSEAPLPHKLYKLSRYQGASERVKKRLEEKLRSELEAQNTESGEEKPPQQPKPQKQQMRIVKKSF